MIRHAESPQNLGLLASSCLERPHHTARPSYQSIMQRLPKLKYMKKALIIAVIARTSQSVPPRRICGISTHSVSSFALLAIRRPSRECRNAFPATSMVT